MKFDAIVIGAGSGLRISYYLALAGKKVAIVESGPFGGTCLNRGCIPSKMLIHGADVMEEVLDASQFGIKTVVKEFQWSTLQKRTWKHIDPSAKGIENGNTTDKNVTVFKGVGTFVGHKKLQVNGKVISAPQIFICAGTRPMVPQIDGLEKVPYWTSKEALRQKKMPKHLVIIGGGYIAAELGHLYSSLGSKVTLLYRGDELLKREDKDVSSAFTEIVSQKYTVVLHATPDNIAKKGTGIEVTYSLKGKNKKIIGDALLIATGRISNADSLNVTATGVKVSKHNYVNVNRYMETNVPGVWAIGDIAGKYFFKHSANAEASIAVHNALNPHKKKKVNYTAMPHAVFTSPQIAGVGLTEQELIAAKKKYLVGKYNYANTGMGVAIGDNGFVKVLVDPKTKKIVGCHILGKQASTLIHEVILAMRYGITADKIVDTIHIHPALSEVVERAFGNVEY